MTLSRWTAVLSLTVFSCHRPVLPDYPEIVPTPETEPPAERVPRIVTIVGTNDVHGEFRRLPRFAGYVATLRNLRDGGVVLVDAGDMWQGTLPSNLNEGARMVAAYNALGYDAVTIGNHEFDYGPNGPLAIRSSNSDSSLVGDVRRGALFARVAEARFPVLAAAFRYQDGRELDWPGVQRSTLIEKAGVSIGLIGVSTEETFATTIAANVDDLQMLPLAEVVVTESRQLREAGAEIVVVIAHAGGRCEDFSDPRNLSSCDDSEEVFRLARALDSGSVDVIVGGHTHQAVAHEVNGIAIIESYANGRAFGRVDVVMDGDVRTLRILPPTEICAEEELASCPTYEESPIAEDPTLAGIVSAAVESAEAEEERALGVTLVEAFSRSYREESPLGNLFAGLLLRARPNVDLVLVNAGGLRDDLAAGPLTYGELYRSFPFDNRVAIVEMTQEELGAILLESLAGGALNMSGVTARVECTGTTATVAFFDRRNRRLRPGRTIRVLTSDYVATTPTFMRVPRDRVRFESDALRDLIEAEFARGSSTLNPSAFSGNPRFQTVSPRGTIQCQARALQ